jgi:molybdopterin converting factor small subunit
MMSGGGDFFKRKDLEVSIEISLHKTHRRYTDGKETIEVEGKTVGECLRDLVKQYPPMEKEIFKNRNLNSLVEVYLNGESAYPNELIKSVRDGDKINLVYMLSSG